MLEEKRRTKRIRKKKWQIVLMGFVFIYLFFRGNSYLFATRFKTILPEKEIIEDKIRSKAIIIKKESLYRADGDGKLELLIDEGTRVAVGTKIATLTLLDEGSGLNQELNEINRKIDTLAKMNEDKLFVRENNLNRDEDDTLIRQSLEGLRKRQWEINEHISQNTINYFSKEAGIVSFSMDGYEEIYSSSNREDYRYSDIERISPKQISLNNGDIRAEDAIFKIIDNFEWYMIIAIENIKDISSYEEGNSILLTGEQIDGELRGNIEKIDIEKDKASILCKFNTDFYNYYNKRYMDVDIVRYKHEGFKIPTKCIIENGGIKGVYIRDISGIIKFKPIEILKEEDKMTYIYSGDKNNKIEIKGSDKPIKTVTMFDEIFLNTAKIKEGMIIN